MSEGIQIVALRHAEMAKELATLQVAVSSTTEIVFGCSPTEALRVEVEDELVAKFWKLEKEQLRLERPGARVCDLILGLPSGQARLADVEPEALLSSAARSETWC
jgi:hypothetical protein